MQVRRTFIASAAAELNAAGGDDLDGNLSVTDRFGSGAPPSACTNAAGSISVLLMASILLGWCRIQRTSARCSGVASAVDDW